jgi:hypothetical protein
MINPMATTAAPLPEPFFIGFSSQQRASVTAFLLLVLLTDNILNPWVAPRPILSDATHFGRVKLADLGGYWCRVWGEILAVGFSVSRHVDFTVNPSHEARPLVG